MLRMFDMLTETIRPLRVFRDIRSAEQWLDSLGSGAPSDKAKGEPPHLPKIPK